MPFNYDIHGVSGLRLLFETADSRAKRRSYNGRAQNDFEDIWNKPHK